MTTQHTYDIAVFNLRHTTINGADKKSVELDIKNVLAVAAELRKEGIVVDVDRDLVLAKVGRRQPMKAQYLAIIALSRLTPEDIAPHVSGHLRLSDLQAFADPGNQRVPYDRDVLRAGRVYEMSMRPDFRRAA